MIIQAVIFLAAIRAFAQHTLTETLPLSPDVKLGKLSNGLTYFIRKNSRPEQRAEMRLVVNAGSILEDDDQQGLAHFTEHMGFNGTAHFKKNELVSFLQTMGIKFGADLNAYTTFDETVYILQIPLDKKENLDKGLTVLEDWAGSMAFESSEIDKERGVVLEESRLGKGANDRMNKVVFPKLFEGSKYAQRLPIGKDEILKSFKYDVVKRFYNDWYRPDLMAVIVVGDFDPNQTEKMVKEHFEKLKNPAKERARDLAEIPSRKKSEALVVTDKEATNSILQIHYPTVHTKKEITVGDYRESLVRSLFQMMLGSRMQELTQKQDPPFVFGGSNIGGFLRGHEAYSSFAVVGKSGVMPALTALIQENKRASKFGFTAPEVERAKKNLMKGIERLYQERAQTESQDLAEELIRHFTSSEPVPGIENEHAYYAEFIPGITLEELNAYAAKIIPLSESQLIVLTAPEKTDYPLPPSDELLTWATKVTGEDVKPYEEKAVATSLLSTAPAKGKIVSEKENKEAGYTQLDLSNGAKVILKPTDFKNDQVVMTAFRPGGQFLYGTPDRYNAEFASQVIAQMGVGAFSPTDLRKTLAGKSVNVSPRIGTISEGLNGQSSALDIEAMFQLVYLYFTQPRKDDDLFKSFVGKQQAMYQSILSNPQAVLQDTLLKITYGQHPRAPQLPSSEAYGKIDEQRAFEIYKERFASAQGFTFILVGKMSLDTVKQYVETYLASLPSDGRPSTFKDAGVRPAKGVIRKAVYSGAEPKSLIRMMFSGETPYDPDENRKLQGVMEVLNIKVIEKLREELSGIYGGGLSASLNKFPYPNYVVQVSLPCGPENVDKLIEAMMSEIQKIKKDGPSAEDLNKVKENWKKDYDEKIRDNNFWLQQLNQAFELGNDPNNIIRYKENVEALTAADLKAAANKYLTMKNFIQVVLYPQK
jgi:zinc protease